MTSTIILLCNCLLIYAMPVFTEQICSQKDLNLTYVFCPKSDFYRIPSGGVCCKSDVENCTYANAVAICQADRWIILDIKNKAFSREKRDADTRLATVVTGFSIAATSMAVAIFTGPAAPFVAFGGLLLGAIISGLGAVLPPPNTPPTINCPVTLLIENSEFGKLTRTIDLGKVTASDKEDGDISSKIKRDYTSNIFEKGSTFVTFSVTDSEGAWRQCRVNVKIIVPECEKISTGNGTFDPYGKVHHGIQVKCSCEEGYAIEGEKTLTCQSNKTYNFDVPKCNPIRCPNSTEIKPAIGTASCNYHTLEFKTVCITNCSEFDGYELKDDFGFAECKSDKTWTRSLPSCQDVTPPVFDFCPSNIEMIAKSLKTSGNISWNLPSAFDNSGLQPTITQISGPVPGSTFDEGLTPIRYVAVDGDGNESPPCLFDILITVRRCLPPSLKGKYLKYTPLPDYLLGSQVHVSCDGGFQIDGATTMTCTEEQTDNGNTMYWDIGNISYPYCKQINCSELATPANGALVCDKWLFGTMCQIQCNTKYDVPLGPWSTGQYVCSLSTGEWRPTSFVPGCTEKRDPNNMVMPGEIFYFTGNCSDEDTLQMIKENFIKYMQGLQNSNFYGVCMDDDECSIENVEVRCGHVESTRKKRSRVTRSTDTESETVVNFNIHVKWQPHNNNNNDDQYGDRKRLLRTVSNEIKKEVDKGALNMPQAGLEVDTQLTSFGVPLIECGKGELPKDNGLSCGTCPLGYELNVTTSDCDQCPMHFYRDGSLAECEKCPHGSFTRIKGAESTHECKAICPPGTFSHDGLEPCYKCHPNTYQQSSKSTGCTTCPFGTTTYRMGSNSINDCSGFDLKIDESDGLISFGKFGDNITSFSVAFWIRLDRQENNTADIELRDANDQLIMNLTNTFHITLHGEIADTGMVIENKKWVHLAITYDVVTAYINIYIAGTKLLTEKRSAGLPVLHSNSSLLFTKKHEGVKAVLSNVIFSPLTLLDNDISKLSSECSIDPAISVGESFSDPMAWRRVNAELIIPSICDAFDDCLSSPCGENSKCENTLSGYVCKCLNGFTGQHCKIPSNYCAKSQCQNGATCTNSLTGYTCDCEEGYKGDFCQLKIVNGQWSHWGEWSVCSVTCGGGFQQRQRYCDDPAPDPDGKSCTGEDAQNGTCSENACPECPDFPSVYGVIHDCNKTDDLITCTVSCRTGLAFIPQEPPLDLYKCGRDTRYKWNAVPPSCTEFYSPKVIKTKTYVEYPNLPCSNKEDAKRQIIENSQSLQCLANKTCDAEIQIEGCLTPQDTVRAAIELKSTIADGDLDFEGFFNSSTPNKAMMAFLNSVNDLSISANELNTSEEFYNINIGGIPYGIDIASSETRIGVDCKEGHVQSTLFCADCPQGTYYLDKKCEPCEYGMYQDEISQVKCKTCPEGYTTDYRGAKLKTECDVYVVVDQILVKDEKHPESLDNGVEVWVPIVASVLSCIVVVAVTITTWHLVKKRYRISPKTKTHEDMEGFATQRENLKK